MTNNLKEISDPQNTWNQTVRVSGFLFYIVFLTVLQRQINKRNILTFRKNSLSFFKVLNDILHLLIP